VRLTDRRLRNLDGPGAGSRGQTSGPGRKEVAQTNLRPVKIGTLFGYADESGAVLIPARYEEAREFHCDRAAVKVRGKWGFISPEGRFRVPPIYELVGDFHDSRALANLRGCVCLIDRKGRRKDVRRSGKDRTGVCRRTFRAFLSASKLSPHPGWRRSGCYRGRRHS
jgi:hypothetical protein